MTRGRPKLQITTLACLGFVLVACAGPQASASVRSVASVAPTLPAGGVALPTLSVWPLPSNATCGGVGLGPPPFTLEGSAADGVYGLLGSGTRVPTQWPPGYFATFSPSLAIHAPDGSVIAHGGDSLDVASLGGLYICTVPAVIQFLPF